MVSREIRALEAKDGELKKRIRELRERDELLEKRIDELVSHLGGGGDLAGSPPVVATSPATESVDLRNAVSAAPWYRRLLA